MLLEEVIVSAYIYLYFTLFASHCLQYYVLLFIILLIDIFTISLYNIFYLKGEHMASKIIYYSDELTDEFSEAQITPRVIDENYSYEGGRFWKLGHQFFYRIIARPLAYLFLKIKFRHRIVNRGLLKGAAADGCFLYGNHTNAMADAFIPTLINYPRDVFVIVHANNVSMPVMGRITPYLGALPLPDNMQAAKNFHKAIKRRLDEKKCVMIYPEAHIWPYYTKIRPFLADSFGYPAKMNRPVYCFTNTYQKKGRRKTPQIVTYIDGPFFPDSTLSGKAQREQLREQVYNAMVQASSHNNVELIQYIKKGETDK